MFNNEYDLLDNYIRSIKHFIYDLEYPKEKKKNNNSIFSFMITFLLMMNKYDVLLKYTKEVFSYIVQLIVKFYIEEFYKELIRTSIERKL